MGAGESPAPAKPYGVGIVGNCCTHGAGLCAAFKGRADTWVVAAYEKDPRRGKELSEALGGPLADSYDAVIHHPEVVIVAVATDPCDKADMVERAAAAGKHIFLNKPFCDSLDNARRIAAALAKAPTRVWLVHDIPMVRSVPVYARLMEEVRSGKHGRVLAYHHLFGMDFPMDFDLKSVWPERLGPPSKSGGGEMTNMGCYAIDYAVALLGRPKAVTAKARKTWEVYRQADVENFGQIVLDYGDFYAFLDVGKQQLEGPSRHSNALTIDFEHEAFHIDASAGVVTVNNVAQDFVKFAEGAQAVGAVEQLIAAIEKGLPPSSDAASGVAATEVLMAAYQSIVDGGPVSLPLTSGKNPLMTENR
jgi:predicted dehydrogenase